MRRRPPALVTWVSRTIIAGIWVAFFQERQQQLLRTGTKAKALGMEAWVHLMGGVVPGIYLSDVDEDSEFISNQGSFICVFSPEAFMAPEVYRAEMDRYIGTVGSMEPWPGQER